MLHPSREVLQQPMGSATVAEQDAASLPLA